MFLKVQDLGFIFLVLVLVFLRRPNLFLVSGLLMFFLAIPLFYFQIFFTAQRLTYYGAGLVFLAAAGKGLKG